MTAVALLRFTLDLAVVLIAAKACGRLAARLGQPAVLGELVAGLLLGAGLVPFFRAEHPWLDVMSQIGILLLLFETGIECDFGRLVKAGGTASAVAAIGVAVPFALGVALMLALDRSWPAAVFVGAALTATSVGITARVLFDLGALATPEAQIVLGAAVIDDVIGIAILWAVQGVTLSGALTVGAFAAGVLTGRLRNRKAVDRALKPAVAVFTPVFFVLTGARADLSVFNPFDGSGAAGMAILLILAAAAGKAASALAVREKGIRRWAVGAGMIPRGEVGLIFAQAGLAAGLVEPALYSALVAMVFVTTLVAPPLLTRALAKRT